MKTIKEMTDAMQAFADGKEIECYFNGNWESVRGLPMWDWNSYDYRVKEASTFWEPTDGKEAWYTTVNNNVRSGTRWNKNEIRSGRVYQTEELANQALALQLATQRLKKAIWNLNEGKYRWVHDRADWHIYVHSNELKTGIEYTIKSQPSWMYLKSGDLCEQLIASHREDLLLVLGA